MSAEQPPRHRVDRLWPDPAANLLLDEAFADLALPEPPPTRPLVGINMVTSIDGRAQLAGRAEGLSGRADRRLMQLLRAAYDAVGSGAGTLRADEFHSALAADLAARRELAGRHPQPTGIVIAGSQPLPTARRWFRTDSSQPRVAVVGAGSPHATDPLPVVETWVAPIAVPEPGWVLQRLAASGVRSLLLEGGPTTNAAYLAAGVVDELYWTIGARVLATDALPMIAPLPSGSPFADRPLEANLISVHRSDDELFLRYRFGG